MQIIPMFHCWLGIGREQCGALQNAKCNALGWFDFSQVWLKPEQVVEKRASKWRNRIRSNRAKLSIFIVPSVVCELFKYRKGGKGALVKCFKERIVADFYLYTLSLPSMRWGVCARYFDTRYASVQNDWW